MYQTVYKDGRWQVILAVVNALSKAGFETKTNYKGYGGKYSIAVPALERVAAQRIVNELFDANGYLVN